MLYQEIIARKDLENAELRKEIQELKAQSAEALAQKKPIKAKV